MLLSNITVSWATKQEMLLIFHHLAMNVQYWLPILLLLPRESELVSVESVGRQRSCYVCAREQQIQLFAYLQCCGRL